MQVKKKRVKLANIESQSDSLTSQLPQNGGGVEQREILYVLALFWKRSGLCWIQP